MSKIFRDGGLGLALFYLQINFYKNSSENSTLNTSATILLYLGYTATSVSGLILIKSTLPEILSSKVAKNLAWISVIQFGLGSLLYIGSFGLWVVILSKYPLSVAYPIAIGLTLCFSTIVAVFFLSETVGVEKIFGTIFILFGIILISRESM